MVVVRIIAQRRNRQYPGIKNAIHTQQHLPLRAPAVAKWKSDLVFLSKYIENRSEFK